MPIDGPIVEGGCVSVVDGLIQSVGPQCPDGGTIEDLGDVLLTPGLVNAHTHLEFSDLTQPLGEPGEKLPDWIGRVIAYRKQGDRRPQNAIAAGLAESVACGVTTIGEIASRPASDYAVSPGGATRGEWIELLAPNLSLLHEAIGFSGQRVDSAFDELAQRADASENSEPQPARIGLCPHAPYSVHPQLIRRIVKLAQQRSAVVAMHLAESVEELQLLASGTGAFRRLLEQRSMWDPRAIEVGRRPLDYLQMLGEAPRAAVIHGNYLRADEIQWLGERRERMTVVYCPRTHRYFQHGRYPLQAMLDAGVRVAIGTDSRASNPDLNLLADMREALWQHPEIAPRTIWRLGTLDAAFAVGLDHLVGSITPGKRADLSAYPLPPSTDDPEEATLFTAGPTAVWLAGRRVASGART